MNQDTSNSANLQSILDQTKSEHESNLKRIQTDHDVALKRLQVEHETQLHELNLKLTSSNQSLATTKALLKTTETKLTTTQKQLREAVQANSKTEELDATLAAERKRSAALDASLVEAKLVEAKLQKAENKLNTVTDKLEKTEQQLQQARSKMETSRLSEAEKALQITKDQAILEAQIASTKRDLAAEEHRAKELQIKLDAATAAVEAAELRAKELEAKHLADTAERERQMKHNTISSDRDFQDAEPKAIEPDSLAETFKTAPLVYHIRVRTGDIRWAGTDARVWIQMFGVDGQTDKLKLQKSEGHSDKFERGKIDHFIVSTNHIGALTHISIGHDGHGIGSGWYLDWVRVEIPSLMKQFQFVADRWLSKSEGDGKLQCRVDCDPNFSLEMPEQKGSYICETRTGTVSGASLDNAHVFVQIYGLREDGTSVHTDELQLTHPKGDPKRKYFQNGQTDKFRVEASEIGTIEKIRIWHDQKGLLGASWYLEEVEIHDLKTDIKYIFAASRWLSKKEGVVAELSVTSKTLPDGTVEENDTNLTTYNIEVKTGNISHAGTDANVSLMIVGESGDTGDRQLRKCLNHKFDKFRKNQIDVFEIKAVNLGTLTRIKISHDNKGWPITSPDWYLEWVKVTDSDSGETIEFPCDAWLSKKLGLVKELVPRSTSHEEFELTKGQGVNYDVTIVTGDIKEAGTDGHAFIILYGDNQDTGKVDLKNSKEHRDKFQRGQTDSFTINAVDVGEVKKIRIGHDGHREGLFTNPSWYIDRVEVDAPTLGKRFVFKAELWLDKKKGEGILETDLYPEAAGSSSAVTEYKAKKPWQVEVLTSDVKHAGTDANIFAMVTFKDPSTGGVSEQQLDFKSAGATKDNFEKGRSDKFRFELEDKGVPIKLRLWHDGANGLSHGLLDGADWHVASVALLDVKDTKRYEFEFNEWIRKKGDQLERGITDATQLDITSDTVIQDDTISKIGEVIYKVRVTTAGDKKAGTDANISILMTGTNGSSGLYVLSKKNTVDQKKNLFESGQTDEFILGPMAKLGNIKKIQVSSDGHTGLTHVFSTDWLCQSVEVIEDDGTSAFIFDCNQKFSKKDGMVHEFKVTDIQGEAAPVSSTTSTTILEPSTPKREPKKEGVTLSNSTKSSETLRRTQKSRTSKSKTSKSIEPAEVTYIVTTYTANEKKAGTDANIEVVLAGSKGKSGTLKLQKSQTNRNKFEKGKVDVFKFSSMKYCGKLKTVKVISDNARGTSHLIDTQWLCDKLEVVEDRGGGKKKSYSFTNTDERWLSKSKGLSMTLAADNSDEEDDDAYLSGSRSAAGVFSGSESEH